MFEKKQVIFSSGIGVCSVDDIVKLSSDKKLYVSYYLLRSVFDKTVTSYIPVENHQVLLRELIKPEVALKITEVERKGKSEKELAEIDYVIKINHEPSSI